MSVKIVYGVMLIARPGINRYSADSYRNPAAWHTMVLNIWVILRQEAIETRAADIALPRAQPFIGVAAP